MFKVFVFETLAYGQDFCKTIGLRLNNLIYWNLWEICWMQFSNRNMVPMWGFLTLKFVLADKVQDVPLSLGVLNSYIGTLGIIPQLY